MVMNSCTSIRDLGVTVDSKMNFDRHIENIVRDAYIRVGVLFKGFILRDLNLMKMAYTTFIRRPLSSTRQASGVRTSRNIL